MFSWVFPFFSSLPVLDWRSFWSSYPPPLSLGDLTSLSFTLLSILLYLLLCSFLLEKTPSTLRSLSTSSYHLFLRLPLLLDPSSSWVKIFLVILSSSIISRWPNQLILCPFIHFRIFPPLFISSSSRFVRLFHSPFSYLAPYILLNIFLSNLAQFVLLSPSTSMLPLHTTLPVLLVSYIL